MPAGRKKETGRETQTERVAMWIKPSLRNELEEFAAQNGVGMSELLRESATFLMTGKAPESVSLVQRTQQACSHLLGPDVMVVRISSETQAALHNRAQGMGMDAAQLIRQLATVSAKKDLPEIVEYTVGSGWRHAMDVDPQVEIQGGDTKRKHQKAS